MLRERFEEYVDGVLELAGSHALEKFSRFCFPLLLEICQLFTDTLVREEERHAKNPYIRYPEYTWGQNYKQYERYAKIITRELTSLVGWPQIEKEARVDDAFLFAAQIKVWCEALHTEKTLGEMEREIRGFRTLRRQIGALPLELLDHSNITPEAVTTALAFVEEHGATEDLIFTGHARGKRRK